MTGDIKAKALQLMLVCTVSFAMTSAIKCYQQHQEIYEYLEEECSSSNHCINLTGTNSKGKQLRAYSCGLANPKRIGCGKMEEIYGKETLESALSTESKALKNEKMCACNNTDLCNYDPNQTALQCYQTQRNSTVRRRRCLIEATHCSNRTVVFASIDNQTSVQCFNCEYEKARKMGCGAFEEMYTKEIVDELKNKMASHGSDATIAQVCNCNSNLCNKQAKPKQKVKNTVKRVCGAKTSATAAIQSSMTAVATMYFLAVLRSQQ